MLGSTLVTGLRERNGALLITQRSQVQILPPLQVKVQVRGPFSLRGGRASGVVVNGWSTWFAAGRGRTGTDRRGFSSESLRIQPGVRGRRVAPKPHASNRAIGLPSGIGMGSREATCGPVNLRNSLVQHPHRVSRVPES